MYPKRRPLGKVCLALSFTLVAAVLPGCSTDRSASTASFTQSLAEKIDLAATDPGIIVITSATNTAQIGADQPNREVEPISEGAAEATRSFLDSPNLGNPQLEAAVGAIQFALSPFAAAYGAIKATQTRLSLSDIEEVQEALTQSMSSNAAPEILVQKVREVACQKTRRTLVCISARSNAPRDQTPVSAVLEIGVKQLSLKAVKPRGNQYRLRIEAIARLVRSSDGSVLLAKSYHYESGPDLFIDWTRNRGLEDVARTGYQILAEQITDDVFQPVSQPPILIGPGQKKSNRFSAQVVRARTWPRIRWAVWIGTSEAPKQLVLERNRPVLQKARRHGILHVRRDSRHLLARQVSEHTSTQGAANFQLAGPGQEASGSMEIHTGKTDDRVRIPAQAPDLGGGSGAMTDTKWSMDGLEYDRNAVVQGAACLAAVPFGLWEQTVGAVQNHSREKKEELVRALNTVTTREHFEGNLADEVAQHLQSSVADPIRRTDEPMRFAFASHEADGRVPMTNKATECKTALEIQVLSTRFVAKHSNSASRAMVVEVQATVYRTSDGQELYSRPIHYQSSAKRLKDWAASDAQVYRRELSECSQQTAQALVNDLIVRGFVTPLPGTDPAVSREK